MGRGGGGVGFSGADLEGEHLLHSSISPRLAGFNWIFVSNQKTLFGQLCLRSEKKQNNHSSHDPVSQSSQHNNGMHRAQSEGTKTTKTGQKESESLVANLCKRLLCGCLCKSADGGICLLIQMNLQWGNSIRVSHSAEWLLIWQTLCQLKRVRCE